MRKTHELQIVTKHSEIVVKITKKEYNIILAKLPIMREKVKIDDRVSILYSNFTSEHNNMTCIKTGWLDNGTMVRIFEYVFEK